ncbi:hypothetical protein J132_04211 [Termitomyces sp. J132]|nr:hypothetical protein J132_04211 [Termitomyces sp. J132]
MFMPPSNKFKYIIQGRCSLTHYPEFRMLTRENTEAIAKWLYEDVICLERPHFDVRQALFKAVDGDQSRWSTATYSVFWSERVTVRKRMGCSPYYATTGTHPLLPADIVEATYLQPPPNSLLSTTDLIACRAIDLQRRQEDLDRLHSQVLSARRLAAICFKKDHAATIRDYNFKTGDLVLMRNTRIEVTHNKKMKP